jgi:hypothetical protein
MWILTLWLIADGAGSGLVVAHQLPMLARASLAGVALLLLRLAGSALSLSSGVSMAARRPQGPALAPAALALSAVITTIDVAGGAWSGGAIGPYRWGLAAFAWLWALAWAVVLRRSRGTT